MHKEGRVHPPTGPVSVWVQRWLRCLPPGARVLDLAAGGGRHSRLAASAGLRVLAVDRDAEALSRIADASDGQIDTCCIDLESGPWILEPGAFDAVIVTNYLFRPRFALLCGLLAPGGLLILETFGLGNAAYGRPARPDFLLREGEAFDRVRSAGLVVLGYESGYVAQPRPAIVQRVCAARPPLDRERLSVDS
jgi:SAM-dependent methyltransferase